VRGFLRGRGHCSTVEIAVGGLGSQHAHAGILDDLSIDAMKCLVYACRSKDDFAYWISATLVCGSASFRVASD
jgi:hypothetical protein